jgi:hypothetical protein
LEDSADEARLRSLLYTARALRKLIDQVSNNGRVTKQQTAEIDALQAELKACNQEQADLRAKHNWSENHIELPAEREAPSPMKINGSSIGGNDALDFAGLAISPVGSSVNTPSHGGPSITSSLGSGALSPNPGQTGSSMFDGLSSPLPSSSSTTETKVATPIAVSSPSKPTRWSSVVVCFLFSL